MEDLDLTALTAAEIVARVHDGRSSAVDVATAHVARIAEREPTIGAFQEHDPQRVLAEADAVDKRPDRFALPLAGVPVAIKDNIDVAGYPTRHGSAATSAEPARRDDELVKRLRAAGAVIVGKTRMPELGIWGFTQSRLGSTCNPLDEELDPGGSSGGSAAAVAAGMAVLGLGTDGGGSVRIPAASCGLVGLAPTPGVVPLPGGADEHWCGMTTTGPIARTAGDAALMFGVLRGEPLDLEVPDLTRIALSLPRRLHPDHKAAAIGAAARLRAGPGGVSVTLEDPPHLSGLAAHWRRRWHAGIAADVDAHGLELADLERATATMARKGRKVRRGFHPPQPDVPAAWREQVVEWLDEHDHDLLLGPALAWPPVRAGSMRGRGYWSIMLRTARRQPFTQAWNLAGLPAAVAPVVVGGTPVGVQLVGRPGSEAALLAAAQRLERKAVPCAGAAAPRSYI